MKIYSLVFYCLEEISNLWLKNIEVYYSVISNKEKYQNLLESIKIPFIKAENCRERVMDLKKISKQECLDVYNKI